MQEVVEGLTQPLNDEDRKGLTFARSTPRLCEPASEAELNQLFLDNNWTDKLPIVLPTVERVAEMMKHTSRKPDEIVGHHTATHFREVWECTVEQVAVNAVMAGARPEYFPVILAIASTGASARGSSTSSMASMVVVNGPVRNEIDMNAGTGAMGPYNHANATIGRAFGLLSQNLQGGSVPGDTYMGSMGNALGLRQPDLRRKRRAQSVRAAARAARLPGRAERGQRVRRHAPYGFYAGTAARAIGASRCAT